ncbi:hypothetical protein G9O61_00g010310 [Vairimorpha ceranae]|nr:hypothetical protein G9O61_00g010250 [Vairimorpha ceranae]KAF5140800.1 hypothetical protein G9O61_00g010310 [Vairimorpha ceranae]
MEQFNVLEMLDEPKVELLQKTIGTLNTSFNSLLEDDLKSKLTEKKLKRGSLMLSYIEKVLIEIILKSE